MYRHGIALLIAPLVTPLLFTAWLAFEARGEGAFHDGGILAVLVLFGVPAYGAALLLGVPTIVGFRMLSVQGLLPHLVGGFAIGTLAGVAVDRLFYYGSADYGLLVLCTVAGASSAALYWLLAFRLLLRIERRERELFGD